MTHDSVPNSVPGPDPETTPFTDAHQALASIQAARAGVAGPSDYPLGYDLAYGTVCGLLVAAQGLAPPWSTLMLGVSLTGLALMVWAWRRRSGWWVGGYSPPRARWVAFAMVAVFLGLVMLSHHGRTEGPSWLYLVSGALGFVLSIAGSRLWMRVWRAELAEGVQ